MAGQIQNNQFSEISKLISIIIIWNILKKKSSLSNLANIVNKYQ